MSAIVIHVRLVIVERRRDEFLDHVRAHRKRVLAREPACQRFDVSVPDDEADTVRLYEVYDDRAAVDHHMRTDYMLAYREETMPLIAERTLTMAVMANE